MLKNGTTLLLIVSGLAAHAAPEPILVSSTGGLAFEASGLTLKPLVHAFNWSVTRSAKPVDGDGGSTAFTFAIDGDNSLNAALQINEIDDGSVHVAVTWTPAATCAVDAVCLSMGLPNTRFAGARWVADSVPGSFPAAQPESTQIFSGAVRSFILHEAVSPDSPVLTFSFDEPTDILLQDNRRWGDNTSTLRIKPAFSNPLVPGETFSVGFTIKTRQPLQIGHDRPVTLEAAPGEWMPIEPVNDFHPGSALDFSSLIPWHQPAGRFGRVKAVGDNFEFESLPGTPQRFYGVNLCFSANYPEPEDAATLATRFRRIGYNAVRLHHQDNLLVEGDPGKTLLNPDRIARLDALMAAFITNGIYVTTDLFVSRSIPWKTIGIDRDGFIPTHDFKLLCAVNEEALENWKAFTREWLTHVNPHTGRSYADEPALAWIVLVNEGNLGNFISRQRTLPGYTEKWRLWLARRQRVDSTYAEIPDTIPDNLNPRSPHAIAYFQFLSETEAAMARSMKQFLTESLGCRALISNSNGWTHKVTDQITHHDIHDYVDDHFYIDHPRFLEKAWSLPSQCPNDNPFKKASLGMVGSAFNRLENKPFTVSEFNFSGPGRYRGVGGIAIGTIAALQNWSALWRFAYSHNATALLTPRPMGYFDIASDPVMAASERAAICLFLRGDVAPIPEVLSIVIPRSVGTEMHTNGVPAVAPVWRDVAWRTRVQIAIDQAPKTSDYVQPFPEAYRLEAIDRVRASVSDHPVGAGAVRIDPASGTFILDTPRTVGGFAESGRIETAALSVDIQDSPAAVWMSALDDEPCTTSARLLLSHVTDVQNTNIRYREEARQTLLAWGALPHLAACGTASLRFAAEAPHELSVYRLSMSGERLDGVKTTIENGRLCFVADTDGWGDTATFFYEIVRERGRTRP